MNAFRNCSDTRDIVPLCPAQRLFLKPIARINISVQLPQLKAPDKSISSWEVMERLRKMVKPEKFGVLRVTKSTLEFIRFEGEVEAKSKIPVLVTKLDMKTIKLSGFSDVLKVRAAEAKIPFPNRHVWDSYFREAKHMNEMKPGERPDTLHVTNIPCKWFTLPEYQDQDAKPSEYIFRKVFETFGEVRYVDVPCTDPYRNRMKSKETGMKTFSFDEGHSFEGYVQYKEYMGFLKAMTALRGMQLLYKEEDNAWTASIKVDYDRTKHMTDHAIRRRHVERERLIQQDAQLLDKERKLRETVEAKKDEVYKKEEAVRLQALEKKKVKKHKHKVEETEKERRRMKKRLALEQQKLREAQQKLQNFQLLDKLLEKVKVKEMLKKQTKKKKKKKVKTENVQQKQNEEEEEEDRELMLTRELELRQRLLLKYKEALDKQLAEDDEMIPTNGLSEAGPSGETADPNLALPSDKAIEEVVEDISCEAQESSKKEESSNGTKVEEVSVKDVESKEEEGLATDSSGEEEDEYEHQTSPEASASSAEESSPVIKMLASDESLDTSDSQSSHSADSESSEESDSSKSDKEPPKKKEKKSKREKEKKKKHKSKKSKKKKKKKESKREKSKSKKNSSKEEKFKEQHSNSEDLSADEAGPSSRVASQVVWRGGGGGPWRGRFPRQHRGRGRPPPWFEGQEFYDFGFYPPPWHFRGAGGAPFFPQRGYRRPNTRRPYYRHGAQPPIGYFDNMNDAYEKYFLKFAKKNSDKYSDDDSYSDRSRGSRGRYHSRSRSRNSRSRSRNSRSRSRSRSRRRHSRTRSRSRSRGRRRSRSRSRSRSRRHTRSRSRSRGRSHSSSRSRSRSRSRRHRSYSRDRKSHSKSRDRSRSRSKHRSHSSKNREHSKSRSKERSKSETKEKQRDRSQSKEKSKSPVKSLTTNKEENSSRSKDKAKSKSPTKSPVNLEEEVTAGGKEKSRSRSRSKHRSKSKD